MAPLEHRKNQGSLFEDDSLKNPSLRHCIVVVEKTVPDHFLLGNRYRSESDLLDYRV